MNLPGATHLGLGIRCWCMPRPSHSLLAEMCRTIVGSGGYLLAWVGYAEHDKARTVRAVAAAGRTEYLEGVHVGWGSDEAGRGPTGSAIRNRKCRY